MEFHSHLADKSKQDASSTHAHMEEVLINHLRGGGKIKLDGTTIMFDHTDGCAKQYRCALALFLLSLLAQVHNIVIDRAVGAPGHGKDIVDGLNATDKRLLSEKMCMIEIPEVNESAKRIAPEAMANGVSKSLAVECARLLSDATRHQGVKSQGKYAKREAIAVMTQRHYHVQQQEDVLFGGMKMELHGLDSVRGQTHNGLMAHYNIRADPKLGVGRVALRRVPCGCKQCMLQLLEPWTPGLAADKQPRYAPSLNCHWWPLFEGLNN
jgi:hypothetical protein